MASTDSTLRHLAAGAATASVVLTAMAFWLSYEHLHDVNAAHGLADATARSWAWPATVDLFIIIGEVLVLRSSLIGRVDPWAVALTILGSAGSIALNVAGVGMKAAALDYVVAGVPPVAALLAFGVIMRQIHEHIVRHAGQSETPTMAPPATPDASPVYLPEEPVTPPAAVPATPVTTDDAVPVAAPVTLPTLPDNLMTTRQFMQVTGVSRQTLSRWKNSGRLIPHAVDPVAGNLYHPDQIPA